MEKSKDNSDTFNSSSSSEEDTSDDDRSVAEETVTIQQDGTPGNSIQENDLHTPLRTRQNQAPVIRDNQRLERLFELEDLLRENLRRQQPQDQNADTVELGQRGSGVRVTMTQWNASKDMRTFTGMANLVLAVFDPDVLLISNVKGGASKIRKREENPPRHSKLDARILEAVAVTVRREFPNSFNTTEMNRAINVKLTKLRALDRAATAAAAAAPAAAAAAGIQEQ
ncbi:uncharacterized protein LOC107042046 [Diachasma alloeum]|uniref:uncharacterized protein LOC107042046 n=1 Tax=Diachasma alloeum TaxID=454923 RepID=UPI0007383946|nr:uncharacterized protein LOC107042046 [Diachasma alloeum]